MSKQTLQIVNPLGLTLHHFTEELRETMQVKDLLTHTLLEPSSGQNTRLGWVSGYIRTLLGIATRSPRTDHILVTWPVLGLLDLILLGMLMPGRSFICLHDGAPLVRAIGYGRIARGLVAAMRPKVGVVVLSPSALAHVPSEFVKKNAKIAAHPLKVRRRRSVQRDRAIRVLGQHKPERDIELISRLAEHLPGKIEVIGRGWPEIPGALVRNEFVDEAELDDLIETAEVVLVPYKRFYQSGIALRAVELQTPVVLTENEFSAGLFGAGAPNLVPAHADDRAWLTVLNDARLGTVDLEKVRDDYLRGARLQWLHGLRLDW